MFGSCQPIDPKLFSIWIITIQFPPLPCRIRGRRRIRSHLLNARMSNTLSHSVCVKPNTHTEHSPGKYLSTSSTSVAAREMKMTKKRLSHSPPVSSSIVLGQGEKWVLLVNRIQNNWEYAGKLAEAFDCMEDGASVDIVNGQIIPFPIQRTITRNMELKRLCVCVSRTSQKGKVVPEPSCRYEPFTYTESVCRYRYGTSTYIFQFHVLAMLIKCVTLTPIAD